MNSPSNKNFAKIKKSILVSLKESIQARNRLGYTFEVAPRTIDRWIADNNPILTSVTAMKVIKEELGLTKSENILDEQ